MKLGRQLVFLCMGLFMASAVNATVLTFEDLSGQGALPSDYAGLTWSSGWSYYDWVQYPYSPASGVERLYNNTDVGNTFFSFASDVVFNGAYFSGNNFAGYDLYNNGIKVFSSSDYGLSSTPLFISSGYSGLVDKVVLRVSNGGFVMDDLTYNAAVPEPASLALFCLGVAGLAFSRRKKNLG